MKKLLLFVLVSICSMLTSVKADAKHTCEGRIVSVMLDKDGVFHYAARGQGWGQYAIQVCNVKEPVCAQLYKTFLVAYTSGRLARLYFDNDDKTCGKKGSWGASTDAGFYFMVLTDK